MDTGGWIALAVQDDRFHLRARQHFRRLSASRTRLWTSNYVLAETLTRLRYDAGHHTALTTHQIIEQAIQADRLRVEWITPQLHAEALDLFRAYSDQRFSFVDCTSFVVARRVQVEAVFGFDKGFSIMGFVLQPEV
ncbi:MAG: PIN domain-containing protein [Chloroflexi bacterium]|nr:PIN domain-containing protein [Chloroflexota bacterium]